MYLYMRMWEARNPWLGMLAFLGALCLTLQAKTSAGRSKTLAIARTHLRPPLPLGRFGPGPPVCVCVFVCWNRLKSWLVDTTPHRILMSANGPRVFYSSSHPLSAPVDVVLRSGPISFEIAKATMLKIPFTWPCDICASAEQLAMNLCRADSCPAGLRREG